MQRLYTVNGTLTMKLVDEVELEKGEDAPMSMAGHPDVCISVHARETILNLI